MNSLDLYNVTEKVARNIWDLMGRGLDVDKEVDYAATEGIREVLNQQDFLGIVSCCEFEKDQSYGFKEGERVGLRRNQKTIDDDKFAKLVMEPFEKIAGKLDDALKDSNHRALYLAIDPIDGTKNWCQLKLPSHCAIMCSDQPFYQSKSYYMKKVCVGNSLKYCPLNVPTKELFELARDLLNRDPIVSILNRPRNSEFIETAYETDCKVRLIENCDIVECLDVFNGFYDIYLSYSGFTEGVISAAMSRKLDGKFQGQVVDSEFKPVGEILDQYTLAPGNIFGILTDLYTGESVLC